MFFAGMALGAMAGAAFGIGLMCCVVAGKREDQQMEQMRIRRQKQGELKTIHFRDMLWSSIFVTLMANKIGGLQFGIYRNCQISSRVFHTAVAALPLTKANRSDFE